MGRGSVKKVTLLIPKISLAVFHLFVLRKSVRYIFSFNFCFTALVFDENSKMGGSRQKMTKYDKGEGSKIAILGVTYFLHDPLLSNIIF